MLSWITDTNNANAKTEMAVNSVADITLFCELSLDFFLFINTYLDRAYMKDLPNEFNLIKNHVVNIYQNLFDPLIEVNLVNIIT